MAGIIHKIEEKLGMGGKKEGEKHEEVKNSEHGHGSGDHHKEGLVDKIKDKIHGGQGDDGKKKKKQKKDKKDKKKHGDGHDSSDSD
ncbi:hypothetical protein SASPL_108486 [Salvia splendens]|uniref:Dehydrin n=1 Tax=Salvia splendens TaxID=180675 RepID=A0A8X8YEF1_SALSN|nr:dehydrin HIRD11 [Salvia splendens]KAG6430420.1 hypothetical protein SASPL_108486 [Salvia splendens]